MCYGGQIIYELERTLWGGLDIAEKDIDKEGLRGFYHHLIQGFKIIIPEVCV